MTKYYIWGKNVPLRNQDYLVRIQENGAVSGIPMDEANSDYCEYLEWLAEGNTPEPWNPEQENK